ncbi:MAG: nitrate/nitrite transporter [Candidatus Omnitrophota bacterium]
MYSLKGSPKEGFWGATLGFFIGFAAVSLFGPAAAKFKDAMQLSPVMVGILVAMPSLSGSILRIPFSAWVDTTGGRKPFLVLLAFSIIGMLALSLVIFILYPDHLNVHFYPLLLLLGLLSGCGIATFSVGISQVSYWFPQKRQGTALGTYAGIGNIAPGVFSFLLPIALRGLGLGGAYLAWLIFLVAGTGLYFMMGKNAWYFQLRYQGASPDEAKNIAAKNGQEVFPAGSLTESLLLSARTRKTWILVAVYFTTFGGFIALTAWLPIYWKSFYNVTIVNAGFLTALYSILTSVIRIGGGVISDKFGGERTAILSLFVMLIGAILMTLSRNFRLSVFAEILMAVGMGVGNAAVFKLVPQKIPQAIGGAAGWVGGLGALGGFVVPPLMGSFVRISGINGYAQGFSVFIILGLISIIVVSILSGGMEGEDITQRSAE